jgi:DNA-binding MarR family transcriptional regulator
VETQPAGERNQPEQARPLPSALTSRSGFLLSMVGRFSRDLTERALAELGIKPHHFGMLAVLDTEGPVPQHSVGERLHIDKSSMTVFVDQLEALGLVERRRNPRNRRAYELTLTDAGRATFARATALIGVAEDRLLAQLDDEERRHLHRLLGRLLSSLGDADEVPSWPNTT